MKNLCSKKARQAKVRRETEQWNDLSGVTGQVSGRAKIRVCVSWFLPRHHVEHVHTKECFRCTCGNCRSSLVLEIFPFRTGVLKINFLFCCHSIPASVSLKTLYNPPALHVGAFLCLLMIPGLPQGSNLL